MTILLKDIWPIENMNDYKIHFAQKDNYNSEPLEVWVRDEHEWLEWQQYTTRRNNFNQQYIFSLMKFYHETETWLFGGIFEVLERINGGQDGYSYKVKLTDIGQKFIGRLKIKSSYKSRNKRTFMAEEYNEFEVKEILPEPYSGRSFPGLEEIDVSFEELEALINKDRLDWKTALESVKGIYLLRDTKTNKKYIGKADGSGGVWSRWKNYIDTGHGGNVGIQKLIKDSGDTEYFKKHFRFALLEPRSFSTTDEKIQAREGYWKEVLGTRGKNGLNLN